LNRYRLVLVDRGGDAPAGRRLAGALKVLLRRFGLKCVEAVEVGEGGAAAGGNEEQPGAVSPTQEPGTNTNEGRPTCR
jgi:hypothetical protein